jgi:hypothetical protein
MVVHINKAYETSWKGWAEYDDAAAAADAPATEGFQAADGPPATAECGDNATTGFPVNLGFAPTIQLYEQVHDPLQMDIQYGSSSNPPRWSTAVDGPLSISFTEVTPSTILYGSSQYRFTLDMIQIAQSTHNNWLLSNKTQNKEDIIFCFKRADSNNSGIEYIFIVVPIIKSTAYTLPNRFLQGIYTPNSQGPFSIRDCFPADNTLFLQYSTCLPATAGGTRNVHVFVSSVGLAVNEGTMRAVFNSALGKRACIDMQNSSFCPVSPPFNVQSTITFNRGTGTFTNDTNIGTGFTRKVRSSRGVVKRESSVYSTASQVIRKDQTGSYKCLPFNPDNEVKDDKIQVDLDSGLVVNEVGEPLSQVLEARAKMIAQEKGSLESKPGVWEKGLATTFAVIFFLIATALLVWLVYTIYKSMTGPPAGAAAAPQPGASGPQGR